ncbi:MAG: type II secretion system GspH family protein [Pyrinomonadaceae bacterium]|nr:type II secretion system GspH family protein [Pyrinomonadaceae bacterium]
MRANTNPKTTNRKMAQRGASSGFSMIEMIIVLVIIGVMSAISLPYLLNYQKQYKSEDQALKVIDMMREASQLALTKRRVFRFEIDLTDNQALIIDGRGAGAADDLQIKSLPLENANDIRVDQIPTGVSKPNPPNYNDAAFITDVTGHLRGGTTVNGNRVWQVAFRADGSVVNAAQVPVSANLYFWTPLTPGNVAPNNKQEVRAVTIFGGSGAVRYWKHNGTTFIPNN